jgi:hypothetical protein
MEKLLLLFCLISIEPFEIDQEITTTPELLETIRRLKENPININKARKIELMLIPYVDNYLAERIIDFRKDHSFTKKEELLLLEGMTPYLFDRIEKFVTVKDAKRRRKPGGFDFLSRLEYKDKDSQNKIYNRITIPYKGFLVNGLFEKDYDEEDYFDYYTASIYIPDKLVIGDYDLDLGMGIILGKPGFFYRSAGIIPGEKEFSPHLSTYEENFFRGIVGKWENLMFFGSYLEKTSWGKEKLLGISYKFSSVRLTGALNESQKKGKKALGSFYADKELAGNLFRFEIAGGGNTFKETKNDLSYSMGIDNGKGLKAIYVNVKDSLPTLRNSPFYKNEESFYLSYMKKISPVLSAGVFTEFSRKISDLTPFDRITEFHLGWTPVKNIRLQNRIKSQKELTSGRLDLIHKLKDLTFRSRFEFVDGSEGSGFLAYTSFRYSKDFILEGRLVLYETENWESRIYAYENDLPGKFTIKQLYGSGRRFYFVLGEKIFPLQIHLKWGVDFKETVSHEVGIAFSI